MITSIPFPMLAKEYNPVKLSFPVYIQPKLNGVRGMIAPNGQVFNRYGRRLKTLDGAFGTPPYWLDGEIWCPTMKLQEITGLVRENYPDADSLARLCFHAFDIIEERVTFTKRLAKLIALFSNLPTSSRLTMVPTILHDDNLQANTTYRTMIKQGYEGVIYRAPAAYYVPGKTHNVMKRKNLQTAEYLCIGVEEGLGKFTGVLGAFKLQTESGTVFACGGGDLTNADRARIFLNPPIGEMITVRFPYLSADNIPQQPQFVAVRGDT